VLSFGTAGCNLGCKFCQNWDISKAREVERLSDRATPERIARAAKEAGCTSVAFTYNDPVIFAEFAIDTALACHEAGIRTVAVTAGYITDSARRAFFGPMDAANVDLKAFTEGFYEKLCFARLAPVLDTLVWLKRETNVWFEVTTLLIPGLNDSVEEIERLSAWFARELGPDVPLHFTAFHPDFRVRDRPPTPPEPCFRAREQARAHGLRFVYAGNVHGTLEQSTRCPSCDALLVERDWYRLGRYALEGNACAACGAAIPGRFPNAAPGTWGRRRLRVTLDA
jgi:pyruvate formate lyase activating enzyme